MHLLRWTDETNADRVCIATEAVARMLVPTLLNHPQVRGLRIKQSPNRDKDFGALFQGGAEIDPKTFC